MNSNHEFVSFPRRLAALLYDIVAVFSVLYFASFVPIVAGGGNAIAPGNPVFVLYLLVIAFGYFGLSWTRGRTLGMQAWRIQVKAMSGDSPSITALNVRFFTAIVSLLVFGMGFWWQLFDREGLTWHDRLSRTRLRYYPKPEE